MTNHKDLKSISEIYKTDKLEHGYMEIYEGYFEKIRYEKLKILLLRI